MTLGYRFFIWELVITLGYSNLSNWSEVLKSVSVTKHQVFYLLNQNFKTLDKDSTLSWVNSSYQFLVWTVHENCWVLGFISPTYPN